MVVSVKPVEQTVNWRDVLASRSAQVDSTVRSALAGLLKADGCRDLALAAVGGYGRNELFPHSDVDLLILVPAEQHLNGIKEPLAEFLRELWDAGLRISHSTRTVDECCQFDANNAELSISLLDCRFLGGSKSTFEQLQKSLPTFFSRYREALIRRLAELTIARHTKFNNTIFHLEPNVKETAGGIRDIHFLYWCHKLAPENEALAQALLDITEAREFLYPLRIFLHRSAGRDNNLLTFELQDEAAADLGQGAEPAQWMREYFLHARQTWQAARRVLEFCESLDRSLLRQFRERRSRLTTSDYSVLYDRIYLRNVADTLADAESVLRLFTFAARHGLHLSWDAQRRLRAEQERISSIFESRPAQWSAWCEFLSQPHTSLALHEMQESGVLSAALPEWNAIDGLVVRDFYHRYTVDEHTLVAIGVVDNLALQTEGTAKRIQKLFSEIEDSALLRLALLLHDIGKGTDPGQHVAGSLVAAEAVMNRLDLPREHRSMVRFLIEHHLDLSLVMNGRDLEDPATARFLTSRTQTVERLRYLTLLTYADISAVNPTAMTPWRLEQLWLVFTTGQEQLTRELETDRIKSLEDLPEDEREPDLVRFLQGLPTRYLRTHSAEEIRRHCAMQGAMRENQVAVELLAKKGFYQLTVLAIDKPGLFASVCGALASFGLNIVKAEAFGNQNGLIVDQFRFSDPLHNLELNPSEIDRLRRTVERVILETEDVRFLLKSRRPRFRAPRVARIAPLVRFNNEASDTATLVDFVGEDRPGLLYDLVSVFTTAGCNIEIVMIDTEAHRAVDVFYVTCNGQKLDEPLQQKLQAELLRAAEGVAAAS